MPILVYPAGSIVIHRHLSKKIWITGVWLSNNKSCAKFKKRKIKISSILMIQLSSFKMVIKQISQDGSKTLIWKTKFKPWCQRYKTKIHGSSKMILTSWGKLLSNSRKCLMISGSWIYRSKCTKSLNFSNVIKLALDLQRQLNFKKKFNFCK